MAGAEPSQTSAFPDFSDRLFSDPAIKEIQHRMDVLWQHYPDLKKVVDNKNRKKTLTRAPIANKDTFSFFPKLTEPLIISSAPKIKRVKPIINKKRFTKF